MIYLPRTLHGRLYLLSPLFTFALRAAMLTDLYLTGYVTDEDDWAHVSDAARPDDPVLAAACDHITGAAPDRGCASDVCHHSSDSGTAQGNSDISQ